MKRLFFTLNNNLQIVSSPQRLDSLAVQGFTQMNHAGQEMIGIVGNTELFNVTLFKNRQIFLRLKMGRLTNEQLQGLFQCSKGGNPCRDASYLRFASGTP